ncbi:MAG TPA: lipocalin-like domain-containing protein [Acidimicrobiia bacterium]|nr:lipocalin-like domain-containing protein [Acidimicrobiia bacterium]
MDLLVGTWHLVDWTASVNATVIRPFGGRAEGLLTYTDDARMWATLQRRDRPRLGTGTLAAATAEQRGAAAAGFLSYAGRYTVDGDRVTHHVEVSLFPDWVGDQQVRLIGWEQGDLVLSTPPETTTGGRTVVNRLRWRR